MKDFHRQVQDEIDRLELSLEDDPRTKRLAHLRAFLETVDEAAEDEAHMPRKVRKPRKTKRVKRPRKGASKRGRGRAKAECPSRARGDGLTELQHGVLNAISTLNEMNEQATDGAIAEIAGCKSNNIFWNLNVLIQRGLVKKIGSGRGRQLVVSARKATALKPEAASAHASPPSERSREPAKRALVEVNGQAKEVIDYLRASGVDAEALNDGRFRYAGDRIEFPDLVDRANRQRMIEGLAKFPGGRPKAA